MVQRQEVPNKITLSNFQVLLTRIKLEGDRQMWWIMMAKRSKDLETAKRDQKQK